MDYYRNEEPGVLEILKSKGIVFYSSRFGFSKEYYGIDGSRLLSDFSGISFFGNSYHEPLMLEIAQEIKAKYPNLSFYWNNS